MFKQISVHYFFPLLSRERPVASSPRSVAGRPLCHGLTTPLLTTVAMAQNDTSKTTTITDTIFNRNNA